MNVAVNDRVLAEVLGPNEGTALRIKQLVLVALGVVALAVCAKISIPMWPVPATMGTFAVLTIGAAYGPRLGIVTIAAYLAVGALGMNVFANSSAENYGLAYMYGNTGGYLVGYALAGIALGFLARRGWDKSFTWMALAMLVGNALIYIPGLMWLGVLYGWDNSFLVSGFAKFIGGDLLKLALAALILPGVWKMVGSART